MKHKINLFLLMIAFSLGLVTTSCSEDDVYVAEAVLGSTRNLQFEVQSNDPVVVTITSDGEWRAEEIPEWCEITPTTGSAGQTDVTISVTDNIRTGAADLPRRSTVNFRGDKKGSIFALTIRQAGDKYRDIQPMAISQVDGLEEESAVMFENLTVYSKTAKGFIGTDGTNFVYCLGKNTLNAGDKVSMLGTKADADNDMYTVSIDKINSAVSGGTVPTIAATDVTADLDKMKVSGRVLIKATGAYDGNLMKVSGKTNSVQFDDNASTVDLKALSGHQIEVTGLYCGTATPVVRMVVTEVKDLGLNENIYFQDDFSWIKPWLGDWNNGGRKPGNIIESPNRTDEYNPQLTTPNVNGETLWDLFADRGYNFLGEKKANTFGTNYLRISITDFQGGIVLPKMPEMGEGVTDVKLKMEWTPYSSKSDKFDQTEMVIIVDNGDKGAKKFDWGGKIPTNGTAAQWYTHEITLAGIVLDKDTRITIRNIDTQCANNFNTKGTYRFLVNSVKVYKEKE